MQVRHTLHTHKQQQRSAAATSSVYVCVFVCVCVCVCARSTLELVQPVSRPRRASTRRGPVPPAARTTGARPGAAASLRACVSVHNRAQREVAAAATAAVAAAAAAPAEAAAAAAAAAAQGLQDAVGALQRPENRAVSQSRTV